MDEDFVDSKPRWSTFAGGWGRYHSRSGYDQFASGLSSRRGSNAFRARASLIPSLKKGEAAFVEQATLCRRYGAAVVVMAFDEKGQADTLERRKEICSRAYRVLVQEVNFPPEDIIFDPNIFAIGTGIEEHATYRIDFIEATRWIKTCPAYS